MRAHSLARSLRVFRSFARSQSALSRLEFALILPIMVTLYFGGVELGDALTLNRKVTHVTSTISDLVTQSKTLSNSDITNIFNAAASIMAPYGTTLLKMKVTEVYISAAGVAKVVWSDARNDTALSVNAIVALPAAVATPSTYLVTSEVHYAYTPSIGYVMTGTFDLNDKFYLRPRLTADNVGIARVP